MQPNIVMISIDSLRRDFCSFIEPSENTTPFMNELSAEGVSFDKAISPSIWTLPVHTSIFTGLYPTEHNITSKGNSLGEHLTLAELLKRDGYDTAAFLRNNWLQTGDILRGFEEIYAGKQVAKADSKSVKHRLSTTIGDISKLSERTIEDVFYTWKFYKEWSSWSQLSDPGIARDNKTIPDGIEALKDVSSPFFFFIHLNEAHWPYSPPSPYHRMYSERTPLMLSKNRGIVQRRIYSSREDRLRATANNQNPPKKEIQTFKDLYRSCIRYVDDLIQSFVEELKLRGYWDNTLLIIFGDHGDNFGENDIFGHHFSVSDELIRVPLLMRFPDPDMANNIDSKLVQLNDLYPTISETVGCDYEDTNSINFLNESRDYAYVYYENQEIGFWETVDELAISSSDLPPDKQYAVWKSPKEKAIWYPSRNEWVKSSGLSSSLQRSLKDHIESLIKVPTKKEGMSDEVQEHLQDMGYLR